MDVIMTPSRHTISTSEEVKGDDKSDKGYTANLVTGQKRGLKDKGSTVDERL
jgi:hypothetical protein